jgi:hypothetical protein
MFCSAVCSPLRAEGLSCSLDVFCGGLGIRKLQFLIQKNRYHIFSAVNLFKIFGNQNPGSGSVFSLKAGSGSRLNESGSETLLQSQLL